MTSPSDPQSPADSAPLADRGAPTAPARPEQGSVFDDVIEIFYAPTRVFERRRVDGKFGLALGIYLLLMAVLVYTMYMALAPAFEADMVRATQRSGQQLTPEMMEQMRRVGMMFGPILVALGVALGVLLVGVAVWLVGKFFDASLTLGLALVVATFAQFPRLLGSIAGTVQGLVLDPSRLDSATRVMLSPVRFMDPDVASPVAIALLSRVELFTLWATLLIGIGIHVVGRIPASRAYLAAFIIWMLGSLPGLLGALRQ